MRTKKALYNTISGLIYEFVALVCGLIIPRLILKTFGSDYNGITNSIAQFLSCVVLLRAGIDGVTKVALYKPLADEDTEKLSRTIKAAEGFMRKVGILYILAVLIFAVVYPFKFLDSFPWAFSATLVLILAISSFMENYIGFTYQILLNADQRYYVTFLARTVSIIVNALLAYILIKLGGSIHVVKLGSAIAFSLSPIIFYVYAHKKYKINKNVEPDNSVLKQRWDAVAHQIAYFVNENTDIMVLSIFATLKDVSVYTVYHIVTRNVIRLLKSSTAGIGDAFGNMMAKKESKIISENFDVFELVVFSLGTILFTTTGIMIVPFVLVYTKGVTDAVYSRPLFACILVLASFFNCIRIPYQHIVEIAGHFKQTKKGALVEAGLNIVISIAFVIKFGLIGVAIGTLVATIFRTLQYSIYMSKNIIQRKMWKPIIHIIGSFGVFALTLFFYQQISNNVVYTGYWVWAFEAMKVFIIVCTLSLIKIALFYRKQGALILSKLSNIKKDKKLKI